MFIPGCFNVNISTCDFFENGLRSVVVTVASGVGVGGEGSCGLNA